jgi:large subunit ribosomal protein L12
VEYIYSALLLHSANKEITEENVKKVLHSVGAKVDESRIKALIASLEGVNIDEVTKQAAMPTAVAQTPEKEEKAEEKTEEEKGKEAEEAVSGLASLFG